MNLNGHVPLVVVHRGESIDTIHIGAVAMVDSAGRMLGAAGDVRQRVYVRSGAKPFQLLPVIETGAAERFGFADRELAIMAGSHSGEPDHVEVVKSILKRSGIAPDLLRCGTHRPFHRPTGESLARSGRRPSVLQNNCSGKHAGMLALALHLGAPLDAYPHPDHPVQRSCRASLAGCCDHPEGDIGVGRDGCGVPAFALPLWKAAYGYARLVDPRGLDADRAAALRRVAAVMQAHPRMVGGSRRLCTELMEAFPSRLIVKVGAQGFIAAGFRRRGTGVGIAVKMADGDSGRVRAAAILEALRLTGEFPAGRLEPIRARHVPATRTLLRQPAGRVEPVFRLREG